MPRTKVIKSKPPKHIISGDNREEMLKTFEKYAKGARHQLERELAIQLQHFNDAYQLRLTSLGEIELQKTLQQIRDEHAKVNNKPMPIQRSVSSNRDDGYITDNGRPVQKKNTRLSRSLSRSNATATSGYCDSSSVMGPPSEFRKTGRKRSSSTNSRAPRNCYRTPMNLKTNGGKQFAPITPKVTPNTPMTVLRRPRQGEMVVSLSGSPLLVNSISTIDEQPNCNIPLEDGTMISLMPSQMRQSTANIPFEFMHQGVIDQLSTLRNNIDIVVKLGQRNN